MRTSKLLRVCYREEGGCPVPAVRLRLTFSALVASFGVSRAGLPAFPACLFSVQLKPSWITSKRGPWGDRREELNKEARHFFKTLILDARRISGGVLRRVFFEFGSRLAYILSSKREKKNSSGRVIGPELLSFVAGAEGFEPP